MRRRHAPTHPYQDDSRGPRIQKVLAEAGLGSRRACEDAVAEGRVVVNGHRIDGLPAWVDPAGDDIRLDGRRIRPPEKHVYVMLFKPKGYVTSNSDPEGRPRAIDLVAHPSRARLFPVGRLHLDSSGLVLLTNDGALANRLTHPRFEMHKGYEVVVGGRIAEGGLDAIERALFPRGAPGAGPRLSVLKRDASRTLVFMELREGRNTDVRRTLAALGHPVRKMRRVSIGPLKLKSLQAGEWRDLTARELAQVRDAAFATPQERAARRTSQRAAPAYHDRPRTRASGRSAPRAARSSRDR